MFVLSISSTEADWAKSIEKASRNEHKQLFGSPQSLKSAKRARSASTGGSPSLLYRFNSICAVVGMEALKDIALG